MKATKYPKYLKYILIVPFSLLTFTVAGQMMEPDDPGNDPISEPPLGGGAPVSGGMTLLILLGTFYGAKKVYELKRKDFPE